MSLDQLSFSSFSFPLPLISFLLDPSPCSSISSSPSPPLCFHPLAPFSAYSPASIILVHNMLLLLRCIFPPRVFPHSYSTKFSVIFCLHLPPLSFSSFNSYCSPSWSSSFSSAFSIQLRAILYLGPHSHPFVIRGALKRDSRAFLPSWKGRTSPSPPWLTLRCVREERALRADSPSSVRPQQALRSRDVSVEARGLRASTVAVETGEQPGRSRRERLGAAEATTAMTAASTSQQPRSESRSRRGGRAATEKKLPAARSTRSRINHLARCPPSCKRRREERYNI